MQRNEGEDQTLLKGEGVSYVPVAFGVGTDLQILNQVVEHTEPIWILRVLNIVERSNLGGLREREWSGIHYENATGHSPRTKYAHSQS